MSKKIFVIDDEESVRKAFILALEDSGHQVLTAENGEKGLALFADGQPDLVFLDLRMPGMNGVEVLRHIREKNQTVPVYIVTAFHKDYFEELAATQPDGIQFELLNKPIGQDEILAVTETVLNGRIGS